MGAAKKLPVFAKKEFSFSLTIPVILISLIFLGALVHFFIFDNQKTTGEVIQEDILTDSLSKGKPAFSSGNFQNNHIQTRIIRGSQRLVLDSKLLENLNIKTLEAARAYFSSDKIKALSYTGNQAIMDIEQDKDAVIKMAISGSSISMIDLNSYIIELKQDPAIEYAEKRQEAGVAPLEMLTLAKDYQEELNQNHRLALEDINEKLSQETFEERVNRIILGKSKEEKKLENVREFKKTFNGFAFKIEDPRDLQKIKKSQYVERIYPDSNVKAFMYDSAPMLGVLEIAENIGLTGNGITVGIVDTGVDYTHSDLGGCLGEGCKVKGGYDFINLDSDPIDDQGHGTHVAGTIAGGGNFIKTAASPEFNFVLNKFSKQVYLKMSFENYTISAFPLLYGDGAQFLGLGESSTNSLITSSAKNITLKIGNSFVVSGNFTEKMSTRVFNVRDINIPENRVLLQSWGGNQEYLDIYDSLLLGNSLISIVNINSSPSTETTATLSIDSGNFNTIYGANNYIIDLPSKEFFPSSEIILWVKNSSENIVGGYKFGWENEEIKKEFADARNLDSVIGTGSGIRGIAPNVSIYAYKVLDSSGSGTMSGVISGIEASVDPNGDGDFSDHLDIISLSLGGAGNPDDPVSQAIDRAVNLGVVAVVAAGNEGSSEQTIGSPGTARNALTVGAVDKSRKIAGFSSRGPVLWDGGMLIKPDLVAPGVNICSSQYDSWFPERQCLGGEHIFLSGTSMATPHVSGIAALLKQANPSLTPGEIKELLKFTCDDLGYEPNTQGSGLINLSRALRTSILPSQTFIDFGNAFGGVANRTLEIKNLGNTVITLSFQAQNITDKNNYSYDVVRFNQSSIVFEPGSKKTISINLALPAGLSGSYSGKILISDNLGNNYFLSYFFVRLSYLTLEVKGNHYPYFYIHDENLTIISGAGQGSDFQGNNYTFLLPSGKYYAYAINDFIGDDRDETEEYILAKSLLLGLDERKTISFDLAEEKQFTVKASSKRNVPLELAEWTKGISIYRNKSGFCAEFSWQNQTVCENNIYGALCYWDNGYCGEKSFSIDFADPLSGDRKIYLSNKPESSLDYDILLKYVGKPRGQ